MASGAIAEASFDYGFYGVTTATAGGLFVVAGAGGLTFGWAINNYVLTEGGREAIGNGELGIGEFFGYRP